MPRIGVVCVGVGRGSSGDRGRVQRGQGHGRGLGSGECRSGLRGRDAIGAGGVWQFVTTKSASVAQPLPRPPRNRHDVGGRGGVRRRSGPRREAAGLGMRAALKGALRPRENDSGLPAGCAQPQRSGRERMHRYPDSDEVDMLSSDVAPAAVCLPSGGPGPAGASSSWSAAVLGSPIWVSDEEGSAHLYWNDKRIMVEATPSRWERTTRARGGGVNVPYAGYTPRFRLRRRDTQQRRRRLADQLLGHEATLRRSSGNCRWLVRIGRGRSAPLPALAASEIGAAAIGHGPVHARMASRCRSDRWRSPTASSATGRVHLPWVLPARLQGERQSQPAGN